MRCMPVVVAIGFWACSDPAPAKHDASTGSDDGGGDDAMPDAAEATDPEILHTGTAGLLLRGTIVLPTGPIVGEVLVEGNAITCAAASCPSSTATIVDTHSYIYPGLIDASHATNWQMFDGSDWTPPQLYNNSNQWATNTRFGQVQDARQYLGGEGSSPIDLRCEMVKHGELRALLSGTTTLNAMTLGATSLTCYRVLARSVDGESTIRQSNLVIPDNTAAMALCNGMSGGTIDKFIVRVAEGTDATALNEFATLQSRASGCLMNAKTTILRGTALGDAELTTMATAGMSLIWSPGSDAKLYGTDATDPAEIPLARQKNINVALGTSSAFFGASKDVIDEMRAAEQIDATLWGNVLTPKMLFEMVTINAANALGRGSLVGSLAAGKRADLLVLRKTAPDAYDALVAAYASDVRLVMVDGVALTGHTALASLGPAAPGCETLDVCGRSAFMCAATTTTTDKMNQTVVQIETALSDALTAYDQLVAGMAITAFSPITPLVDCP